MAHGSGGALSGDNHLNVSQNGAAITRECRSEKGQVHLLYRLHSGRKKPVTMTLIMPLSMRSNGLLPMGTGDRELFLTHGGYIQTALPRKERLALIGNWLQRRTNLA